MKKLYPCFLIPLFLISIALGQSIDWVSNANDAGLQTNGITYTADGSQVLTGTNCHPANIRLFDASNGNQEWDFIVSNNLFCIMGVGLSSGGKYIGAIEEFGNLLVFDNSVSPPDSINTIDIGSQYGFSTEFSPIDDKVAVGGSGGKLVICDVISGSILHTVPAHANWVTSVGYSPAGDFIVTGGNDKRVKVWDTTGVLQHFLTGHTQDITKVRFSPDGQKVISTSRDNTLKVWDLQTGAMDTSIYVSNFDVTNFAFSPSSSDYLVTASADNILRFFSTTNYARVDSIEDLVNGHALCVDWSPTHPQIVAGTISGKAVAYSVPTTVSRTEPIPNFPGVTVFPNPFAEKITVSLHESTKVTVTLTDITGKVLQELMPAVATSTYELSTSSLPAGIYLLRVSDRENQRSKTQKLIKY